MPRIYDYVEKDGFEGTLILDSDDDSEAWLENNEGGAITLNEAKTAKYNQSLNRLLTSREQMDMFRHA